MKKQKRLISPGKYARYLGAKTALVSLGGFCVIAQETVLLRAAQAGEQTPAEELLRAGVSREQ